MTPDRDFQLLATGIPGAEGPLVTRDGRIFVVSPPQGAIFEILPGGQKRLHANTGGIPAGLQLDRNGDFWVADMQRGIFRVTPEGAIFEEVIHFEGQPIRGCNDLSFDGEGNLYFTAPAGSNGKPGGNVGEVFFRSRLGNVKRLGNRFAFPNGIAVSTPGDLVIFSETFTKKLLAFRLAEPGVVTKLLDWAALPIDECSTGGDGIDFDASGNLVATYYGKGTLEVFNREARLVETISLPFRKCSNVHFFNNTSGLLLVTEHESDSLWSLHYGTAGQRQFGWI